MEIITGTEVRSFDFSYERSLDGPRSCYMEGKVVGFKKVQGCMRYVIDVDRCIAGGEEKDFPPTIYPPVNGTLSWTGRVTDGVERIN